MDNHGDEDAGETSAVKSKIQQVKPSDQETATHEASGSYPHLESCRACVGGPGRSDAFWTTARRSKLSSCGKHGLLALL